MNPKLEKQTEAREMRKQGFTYPEIEKAIGCPRSSVHNWVKDVKPLVIRERKERVKVEREEKVIEKIVNLTGEVSKQKGDVTELMVAARLVLKYTVLHPFGDNKRYDLVIEKDNKFERVQCKTGRYRNGCVIFNTQSSSTSNGEIVLRSYRGQIEYFGVYCPDLDTTYLVPIEDSALGATSLRVEDPKGNQGKEIRWAKDYLVNNGPVAQLVRAEHS